MATLPKYANADLVMTALLMGGLDPTMAQTIFQRNNGDPSAIMDDVSNAQDDHTRQLASLALGYIDNPGTGHLTTLLKFGGVDENTIAQAISNVQGPNPNQKAPTPQVQAVLAGINQLGGGDILGKVNTGLQQVGVGQSALTTTREQYLFPAQNPPAPQPGPAPAPGAPGGQGTLATGQPATAANVAGGIPAAPYAKPGQYDYSDKITLPAAPVVGGAQKTPGAGAATGGGGGGGTQNLPPPPPPTTPQQLTDYINQNAGAFGWFQDIPEVANIINTIAGQKGTLADKLGEFDQQITQTQWWKNTSATARSSHAQMLSDPGTWAAAVSQQATVIGQLAKQEGINIDPDRLNSIAQTAETYQWSPEQIKGAIASEYQYNPNAPAGDTANFVKATASKYLMNLSNPAIQQWTQSIMNGNATQDTFTQYLQNQAKLQMPWMSAQIDAGIDPTTYLDHTKQSVANTLDMNPDDIDWTNSKWSSLIASRDPKTGQMTPNTQDQITQTVMNDPKYGWDQTTGAVQAAASMGSTILKSFGMA